MTDYLKQPGMFGSGPNDWYVPDVKAMPRTSDHPSISSTTPQYMMEKLAPPSIPTGSFYSPSRNVWLTPQGSIVSAGEFRPLPPDKNTIDPAQNVPYMNAPSNVRQSGA